MVIFFLVAASSSLGAIIAIHLAVGRLLDAHHRLRMDRVVVKSPANLVAWARGAGGALQRAGARVRRCLVACCCCCCRPRTPPASPTAGPFRSRARARAAALGVSGGDGAGEAAALLSAPLLAPPNGADGSDVESARAAAAPAPTLRPGVGSMSSAGISDASDYDDDGDDDSAVGSWLGAGRRQQLAAASAAAAAAKEKQREKDIEKERAATGWLNSVYGVASTVYTGVVSRAEGALSSFTGAAAALSNGGGSSSSSSTQRASHQHSQSRRSSATSGSATDAAAAAAVIDVGSTLTGGSRSAIPADSARDGEGLEVLPGGRSPGSRAGLRDSGSTGGSSSGGGGGTGMNRPDSSHSFTSQSGPSQSVPIAIPRSGSGASMAAGAAAAVGTAAAGRTAASAAASGAPLAARPPPPPPTATVSLERVTDEALSSPSSGYATPNVGSGGSVGATLVAAAQHEQRGACVAFSGQRQQHQTSPQDRDGVTQFFSLPGTSSLPSPGRTLRAAPGGDGSGSSISGKEAAAAAAADATPTSRLAHHATAVASRSRSPQKQ